MITNQPGQTTSVPITPTAHPHSRAGRVGRLIGWLAVLVMAASVSLASAPSSASAGSIAELTPHEQRLVQLINQSRAQNGLGQLAVAAGATDVARNWSAYMARSGDFRHNPNYVGELRAYGQSNATRFAENVAYGYPTADAMFTAYMNSAGHRANILNPSVRYIGMGSIRNGSGTIYNTMNFVDNEDGSRPRVLSAGDYFGTSPIRNNVFLGSAANGGDTGSEFAAPWAAGIPVVCDWNGDGIDTVGFFSGGTWVIPESNASGTRIWSFGYGNPSDQPLCGDWNRDGIDTIGVFRYGVAYLRDANNTGAPSVSFAYGNRTDVALAGDFNGDGYDSVGVKRGNGYFLSNAHSRPTAEISVYLGNYSDGGLIGDFNGDRVDTIALRRGSTFIFTDNNRTVAYQANYGFSTDRSFVGNFGGGAGFEKGVYRP